MVVVDLDRDSFSVPKESQPLATVLDASRILGAVSTWILGFGCGRRHFQSSPFRLSRLSAFGGNRVWVRSQARCPHQSSRSRVFGHRGRVACGCSENATDQGVALTPVRPRSVCEVRLRGLPCSASATRRRAARAGKMPALRPTLVLIAPPGVGNPARETSVMRSPARHGLSPSPSCTLTDTVFAVCERGEMRC